MNVTKTIITTTLEKSTDIADYIIEHMSENAVLTRIYVTVKEKTTENIIGNIYQEHNTTGGTFSLMTDVSPYFAEFNTLLEEIQKSIAPQEAVIPQETTTN